jgi:uncharacterized protein (DUF2252 family)
MAKPVKQKRTNEATQSAPPYLSPAERRAKGKALRDAVPRQAQAGWKAPKGRRDPVDITLAANEGRIPNLVPIRHGRMAASPFAFYRGSAALMAADLATTPTSGIRVQACGDAHLMNFGGFATPERNIIFDINDLDETLPAPFEWDLKRLAASVVIAAQYLKLPASDAARVATDVVREYREWMENYASMRALDVWYDKIDMQAYDDRAGDPALVKKVRKEAAKRIEEAQRKTEPEFLYPKFVSEEGTAPRIKDEPPLIFHPKAELIPNLRTGFDEAIAAYRESLPEQTRTLFDRYHLVDVAIKVVGVGSVGTVCGILLLLAADDDPLFLQSKEAGASVLEPYAGKSVYPNHGQRVVTGQRILQSASDVFLGWTGSGKISRRHFYIRQLRDMKMSAVIEDQNTDMLRQYARMCAHALARGHARSGDAAMMAGYMGSGKRFDDAVGEFAVEYADQNLLDYKAFVRAIREGRVKAAAEA